MIANLLLFPYWVTLKVRHLLYDKGWKKAYRPSVPSICIGNITVGGTGKTPHTEMIIRTLLEQEEWCEKNISVLSRGYKRKSKGFQQVPSDGSAITYGDEPLQIKKKFPMVTVAVDSSRKEGCSFLTDPESVKTSKKGRRCIHKEFPKADIIILDDAFQHRAVKADVNIVLVDYNRPIFKDSLLPIGRLRDLPGRIKAADIVIVSKCPKYMEEEDKAKWAKKLKLKESQHLFFTTIAYDTPQAIFPEGDSRYLYAKNLILFSGIANDAPLARQLTTDYKIVKHFNFPDHHKFSRSDIYSIRNAADSFPTSVIMTTEKDCQRVRDSKAVPESLKTRLFYAPIKSSFLSEEDKERFTSVLLSYLR
jgi:tetraacyldisaccharide 4'-kinase